MPRPPGAPRDHDAIRDISLVVYKMKLGPAGVARMLAADTDGGAKLRHRAGSYDNTTVCYLEALGLPVPRLERSENGAETEPADGLFAD